jgi:hypothetical protein
MGVAFLLIIGSGVWSVDARLPQSLGTDRKSEKERDDDA